MKKLLLTILSLQFFSLIQAQNYKVIDSLKQIFTTAKEDTNKVKACYELSHAYQYSYPDSALYYALQCLPLAQKLNFKTGEMWILWSMGEALSMKGDFSKGLEMQFKTLEVAEKLNDIEAISFALGNIGGAYFYAKDYEKALFYGKESIAISNANPLKNVYLCGFLGETYFHLNQLDSSLFYIKRAYDLDLDSTGHWAVPYHYLAAVYENTGKPAKAIELYRRSVNLSSEKVEVIAGYRGLASAFKKINEIDSSIFYAKKAIEESIKASLAYSLIEATTLLTEIYKSINKPDSAFKYQELMVATRDSLFSQEKVKQMQNVAFDEQMRQRDIEAAQEQYLNKVKLYASFAALVVFIIIGLLLWRNNRYKQKAYALLQQQKQETDAQKAKAEQALQELKATQAQLIQSEKMAPLGELTAGIAHEIQNPLNFVNNFSEVSVELIDELKQEARDGNKEEVIAIAGDISANLEKVVTHGKRADGIVKSMIEHSRTSKGEMQPTDINALADEYLRLAYHGMRAKDKTFNPTLKTDFDAGIGKIKVIPQDIGRVLLNLYNNAFYAVAEKKKLLGDKYESNVSVSTKKGNDKVIITVQDNGNGIPEKVSDKIFQPFFTTKPTGQGTGLGLSLSYDIIKALGGEIKVETKEGEGAEFIVQLP